ncbi:MAG TPA: DUF3482 domain-containing protein, partial [Planctomycetota bacterium]|nr:DUF3482 domain-containing protein [Planctomycetota bacterium]
TRAYCVEAEGQVLFTLVDTPGFQDAPAALEQIRRHRRDASVSDAAVKSFIDTYRNSREFQEETRLLRPILEGGRILYVVDGTVPYSSDYEAEMEILRWTGRPRMALVNRIGAGNHVEEWKKALGQFFGIVREFDANKAGFDDRIRLLESFRELDEESRTSLDRSIGILKAEHQRRRREASRIISGLLVAALTQRQELKLKKHERAEDRLEDARGSLRKELIDLERRAHAQLFALYRFKKLQSSELPTARLTEDLFAEKTWRVLGLTHGQLLAGGAAVGAGLGLAIDAATVGHTFGLAALIGGAIGFGSALARSGRALGSEWRVVKQLIDGERIVRFGPLGRDQLPWILLDRALIYFRAVSTRAHSVQGQLAVGDDDAIVRDFPVGERSRGSRLFSRIAKSPRDLPDDLGGELRGWVEERL